MKGINFSVLAWILLTSFFVNDSAAESYRSKVYLDPSKKLSESASLSIEELEKQLGSLTDSYALSSAGRHLARHYVQEKQYDKAIAYYHKALLEDGLSEISNHEMTQELGAVYLLSGDYPNALITLENLKLKLPELSPSYLILLAQAQYKNSDFLGLADTLDLLQKIFSQLSNTQLKQILALAYGGGNYGQCEQILLLLIHNNPSDLDNWRQLASVFLLQDKRKKALDQMTLAYEKGLPLRESDILLLADLFVINEASEKGARLLADALSKKTVAVSAENYKRLFEYWLVAREKENAIVALDKAAQLSNDMELFLKLAQLYMEQQAWPKMEATLLKACSETIEDRFVSRANLLLGVSQLKQGQDQLARRSFINATLLGGRGEKANQWLSYMQAKPATLKERERIVGPCEPEDPKVNVVYQSERETEDAPPVAAGVLMKTVPSTRYFYVPASIAPADLGAEIRSLVVPLGVNLVRGGGAIDGPLHLFFEGEDAFKDGLLTMKVGFPIQGIPVARGRYKSEKFEEFKCVYLEYKGAPSGIRAAWEALYKGALSAGFEVSGLSRQVFLGAGESDQLHTELQLGVR